MCIFIFVYQLSYKTNKINELNKIVESQREITEDIVKKNYPNLENKINDIINIEKYKKLNNDLKNENSGINYFKNKVLDDMKNANRLKTYREYDDLQKQKKELYIQASNLINNKLTINTLNEFNQQNQPLHKQIQYLEVKVKNNYQNKLIQSNNLKNLKANEKIKYILLKLGKYDAPLQEQIDAIDNELKKFNTSLLSKNHNTKVILEKLKRELANNLNSPKYIIDTNNIQKALDNLQKIKNDTTGKYDPNTKDILQKLDQTNKPLEQQINNLNPINQDKELNEQIKELEKQIDKNIVLKDPNINKEKIYIYKLKEALAGIKEIQKIENKLSNNKSRKPTINKDIENTIKYLEDKTKQPNLKANKDIQSTLDRFSIKDMPTTEQLSDLYSNLYSTPVNNTNISELNFVINRLNEQKDLEDKIKYIENILEKIDKPINTLAKDSVDTKSKDSNKEITALQNKIKYLQKKIEKNGVLHLPCLLDNEGSTIYLFKLFLRDDNMHVQLGWQDGIEELTKGLPNLDKLVDKTMSLNTFMKLTKPIFEQTVQDECRHFVYLEDETISKKEYKRKTLTIQHHFYKYIDYIW
jgi:hypothetical protein